MQYDHRPMVPATAKRGVVCVCVCDEGRGWSKIL